jgi:signal transduction histidine kinase
MEAAAARISHLDLRQLRYALALVELRSSRRAAAQLAIPVRAFAREVARIERALGARLVERRGGRTVATAAGTEIAEIARCTLAGRIGAGLDELEGESLRVGWMDFGRGQAIQRAALAEFQARYPHVPVQLVPSLFRDQPRDVADGLLDAGFYTGPKPDLPGLAVEVLFPDTVGSAMLPAGHRLAGVRGLSLSDLSGFPFHSLRMDYAPEIMAGVHDGVSRGGWHGRQTTGSSRPSEVITAVACGAGWAPAPSDLAEWAPPGVEVVPLADGPLLGVDLYLMWKRDDPVAAAFARLVFELRDVIEAAAPPPAKLPEAVRGGHGPLLAQRYAERARVARELHDTLLQDIVGSELQLEALTRRLPPGLERESREIREVVERLERAARSGREVLRNLTPVGSGARDLPAALAGVAETLRGGSDARFRLRESGSRRELRTSVAETAYWVGAEAIANALRHASPALVTVVLEYGDDLFRLRVADDGGGIEPEVLRAGGRDGHLGFALMRERAAAAAGTLSIRSEPARGTEVELAVPAPMAFAADAP